MCLGIPGKIIEVYQRDELPMGKVDFGGVRKEVCLAYTPEAQVGEYVLVHVGFALSRIDEQEAQEIFDTLQQIAQAGAEAGHQPEQRPADYLPDQAPSEQDRS